MDKIHRLNPEERTALVAYLDGELDEDGTQEIERTLARNPVARHEVEILTRTWELLDVLPQVKASEEFTEKTLTSLRLAEIREPLTQRRWFQAARRGAIVAGWAAGLALSAVVGFVITNRWIPDDAELLVRDLPVIERLDVYGHVGSIEFLKQLQANGVLHDDQD